MDGFKKPPAGDDDEIEADLEELLSDFRFSFSETNSRERC
jgi:hypothetical protein